MNTESTSGRPARQEARNRLFAAALQAPQPGQYPTQTHAAYAEAFGAYQASTMQPLRDELAAA